MPKLKNWVVSILKLILKFTTTKEASRITSMRDLVFKMRRTISTQDISSKGRNKGKDLSKLKYLAMWEVSSMIKYMIWDTSKTIPKNILVPGKIANTMALGIYKRRRKRMVNNGFTLVNSKKDSSMDSVFLYFLLKRKAFMKATSLKESSMA